MLEHILELRRRCIIIAVWFIVLFLLFYSFSADVFHVIISPLLQVLPQKDSLIATHMTTPVLIPITLAADLALLGTTPLALFHGWRFAAPGLYREERRGLGFTIVLSTGLFCLGALFFFYGVLPFVLHVFVSAVPFGVQFMPEITTTIEFILRMMVLFGLCFQVPLICVLLVKTGIMNIATLKKARPYWIVTAFILGMLLTPPDVLSQVTLAIPLCLLYELGIILSGGFCRGLGSRLAIPRRRTVTSNEVPSPVDGRRCPTGRMRVDQNMTT